MTERDIRHRLGNLRSHLNLTEWAIKAGKYTGEKQAEAERQAEEMRAEAERLEAELAKLKGLPDAFPDR